MQLFFEIVKNDLKLIFRDKSLMMMFFVPVLIMLFLRFGVPELTALAPVLPGYYWLIISSLISVAAALPAFLIGFLILDEKDENLYAVFQVLPLPQNFILKWRVLFTVLLGFMFSFFIITLNGLIQFNLIQTVLIALQFSLIPPLLALSIVLIAKNKIEAAAVYKALSIFLILPAAAFFIRSDWRFAFGVIPFFWSYNSVRMISEMFYFLINFVVSFSFHGALLVLIYRFYLRRNG